MMRDCQDLNPIRQLDVDDVVGEAPNEETPDIGVGNSRHGRARLRSNLDPGNDSPDGSEKVHPEAGALLVVPTSGLGQLGLRLGTDPDATFQLFLRSRSRRSRTSGQGSPGSSPDRARAARSPISVAHAASASSSAASASRLAISSDASSARSAALSFKASWRSLPVAFVMSPSLARLSSPNKALERTGGQAPQGRQATVPAGRSAPSRYADSK